MYPSSDTITAIATAPGQSALGIVRISGPAAISILHRIVTVSGHFRPGRMSFGRVMDRDTGEILDDVMYWFRKGPGTATGEDVAEIHAHGGPVVLQSILQQALHAGCRAANPGEFTARAFHRGRLDLTQAEAIMSLIGAGSERAARVAAAQMNGHIGKTLLSSYDTLTDIGARLEAGLDFPDEDLPAQNLQQLAMDLQPVLCQLDTAIQSFHQGNLLTRGARVVIAGPSNAGKSSIFNRLAGMDRAIVDAEPGTTRDTIETALEIQGFPVCLCDTAGFRSDAKSVERQGMDRTRQAVIDADLVLLVLDGTVHSISEDVRTLYTTCLERTIVVVNKSDHSLFRQPADPDLAPALAVSAQTGDQINHLVEEIGNRLTAGHTEDVLLTTARQQQAVSDTVDHIRDAIRILQTDAEPELAAADLRLAREAFASLFGRHAQTDVIDRLFSMFCLGK